MRMRNIEDVLHFRSDISPFLVHLTRNADNGISAADILVKIISDGRLIAGSTAVSDVRFGGLTKDMEESSKRKFFGAICFTETPLAEAHSLLEIGYRGTNLSPYGLVFLKNKLKKRGVGPVLYLNNMNADKDLVVRALFEMINANPAAAADILPLFSIFGKKITPPRVKSRPGGEIDFIWEREWRYPSSKGAFEFGEDDVFVGLCPDDEIGRFESMFSDVEFIDPTRNMKWYATKLIGARRRLNLKYSVV